MILQLLIFVLCSLALLREIAAIGSMGPLGHLEVNAVYECSEPDIPAGDDIKAIVDLIKINDQGGKAVNVHLENRIPIDDNLNIEIVIKKFEFGKWVFFYSVKGTLCKALNLYINKLWNKSVGALKPKVSGSCPIPPGSYKLDKFYLDSQDLGIKAIFYGKLMVKITIKDKSGKLLYCVTGDGVSQSIM